MMFYQVDADMEVVPAEHWAQYQALRSFAGLQRVEVSARRTPEGSVRYFAAGCAAASVLELRDALLAAGMRFPSQEEWQQVMAAMGDAFRVLLEDATQPQETLH